MSALRKNVTFQTFRGSYNPLTQQTLGANTNLPRTSGHIAATSSKQLATLPEAAFGTEYYICVDAGTKIAEGDILVNITRLNGTPWPGDVIPPGNAGAPVMIWRVKLILEESPDLLSYRKVFLIRDRLSGPAGN